MNSLVDAERLDVAEREQRVVITKDADFVITHLLNRRPAKLLLISTGNVSNADLEKTLVPQIAAIIAAFSASNFVELTKTALVVQT